MKAYKRLVIVAMSCSLIGSVSMALQGDFSYYVVNIVALLMLPVLSVVYKYYWNNAVMLNILRAGCLVSAGYLAIVFVSLISDASLREKNDRLSINYDSEPDLKGCEYEDLKTKVVEEDKRFFCNNHEVERVEVGKALARSLRETFQSHRE